MEKSGFAWIRFPRDTTCGERLDAGLCKRNGGLVDCSSLSFLILQPLTHEGHSTGLSFAGPWSSASQWPSEPLSRAAYFCASAGWVLAYCLPSYMLLSRDLNSIIETEQRRHEILSSYTHGSCCSGQNGMLGLRCNTYSSRELRLSGICFGRLSTTET